MKLNIRYPGKGTNLRLYEKEAIPSGDRPRGPSSLQLVPSLSPLQLSRDSRTMTSIDPKLRCFILNDRRHLHGTRYLLNPTPILLQCRRSQGTLPKQLARQPAGSRQEHLTDEMKC
jgi:hypothetical protein